MQKYKKPEMLAKDFLVNPLAISLEIPVRDIEFSDSYRSDGEHLMPVIKEVEKTPVTKLYATAELRKITNLLPLRSKELLLWIMYELPIGKDYLWVNKQRYMEEVEITSIDTYKTAIKELIRYCFICPSLVNDVYWINPLFFYKGDRVSKYPKNVKREQSNIKP